MERPLRQSGETAQEPSPRCQPHGLPLLLERRFRPWRYGVSHSELRLRSVDRASTRDFVEVFFCGVLGVKLKSTYESLMLAEADRRSAEEILRFAGVPDARASRVRCLTLETGGEGGFVVCLGFSVWSYPEDARHDLSGIPRTGSSLIIKG